MRDAAPVEDGEDREQLESRDGQSDLEVGRDGGERERDKPVNGPVNVTAGTSAVRSQSPGLLSLLPATARGGALLIIALVSLSLPLSGSIAHAASGSSGVVAILVAAVVCGLAAIVALFLTERTHGTPNAVAGLFGSVLLRTMVPLVLGFAISQVNQQLSDAGVFGWFVVYFLGCLAIETLLVVRVIQSRQDVEAES